MDEKKIEDMVENTTDNITVEETASTEDLQSDRVAIEPEATESVAEPTESEPTVAQDDTVDWKAKYEEAMAKNTELSDQLNTERERNTNLEKQVDSLTERLNQMAAQFEEQRRQFEEMMKALQPSAAKEQPEVVTQAVSEPQSVKAPEGKTLETTTPEDQNTPQNGESRDEKSEDAKTDIRAEERDALSRKMDKSTHWERKQSAKSFLLQVQMLSHTGKYSKVGAIFETMHRRHDGRFGKDLSSTYAQMSKVYADKPRTANNYASKQKRMTVKENKMAEMKSQTKDLELKAFDKTYSRTKANIPGLEGSSKADRNAFMSGSMAATQSSARFLEQRKSAFDKECTSLEGVVGMRLDKGSFGAESRERISNQVLESVSNQIAFLEGVADAQGENAGKAKLAPQAHSLAVENLDRLAESMRTVSDNMAAHGMTEPFMSEDKRKCITDMVQNCSALSSEEKARFQEKMDAAFQVREDSLDAQKRAVETEHEGETKTEDLSHEQYDTVFSRFSASDHMMKTGEMLKSGAKSVANAGSSFRAKAAAKINEWDEQFGVGSGIPESETQIEV